MKLSDGEEKVAEYHFKGIFGGNDVANMSILTNRRLVVVYQNAEESFPLSKITAVRVVYNRSWGKLLVGAFFVFIGLAAGSQHASAGVVGLGIGGPLIYFGWQGLTRLLISQMGGERLYEVRGQDSQLSQFIDAVNGKLS